MTSRHRVDSLTISDKIIHQPSLKHTSSARRQHQVPTDPAPTQFHLLAYLCVILASTSDADLSV